MLDNPRIPNDPSHAHLLKECLCTLDGLQDDTVEEPVRMTYRIKHTIKRLEGTVRALTRAVELKSPYTAGHSDRVMIYSLLIGQAMKLGPNELQVLGMGALIHDIGKIGIPDFILNKPGSLTPEEFEIIKIHPKVGAQIISDIPELKALVPLVRHHHEKLNGTGYPDGLSGDEIELNIRILTVADIFDAITSDRSYRGAMETNDALAILRKEAKEGGLDPKVVEVFAEIVSTGQLCESNLREVA
jgi:putative two-component system response regulator